MTSPVWMPLYVGDYLADTSHLTTLEHGAYMLLIMHYWRNAGLPDDDAKLARICRMTTRQWDAAKATLRDLFKDGWHHSRIDEELKRAADKSAVRATSGMRGGQAKALKTHEARVANATILPENQPSKNVGSRATPSETQEEKKESSASHSSARVQNPTDGWPEDFFTIWYAAYPRHEDPKQAKRRLIAIRKAGEVPWDILIAATHRYAAECLPKERRYVKLPLTWLNAGSWANEPNLNPHANGSSPNGFGSQANSIVDAGRRRLARVADAARRAAGGDGDFSDASPANEGCREEPGGDRYGEGFGARDKDLDLSARVLPSPSLFS